MLKVLIAEDDLIIADMAEEFLVGCGYVVCGIARTVDEAVALGLRHRPDLLVLDVRLADGGLGTDIPGRLTALGRIGVLYATGNMHYLLQSDADGDACISKPYRFADLRRALEIVSEVAAGGEATLPFPRGFQILRPESAPAGHPG
jgi:CheY-like chemotaxis protein